MFDEKIFLIAKCDSESEKLWFGCRLKVIAFHQADVWRDIPQREQETMMGKDDFVNKQGSKNNCNVKKRRNV